MFIDTHCHLSKKDYNNLEEVINEMEKNIIIVSGYDRESNFELIDLIDKYSHVYGTIGIHPGEIDDKIEENLEFLEKNINNVKIVGIGEIGLDYHYDGINKELQKKVFIKQIELAKKYNKTIVVHSRDAAEDTISILKEQNLQNHKVVIHCYSYGLDIAKIMVKMNIKIGIGGVITFKNSVKLKEVVKEIDIKYLLLETDSPYLSPIPFRGKQNKPYNCYFVAEKIAEIKNTSIENICKETTQNAIEQFDLNI